MINIHVRHEKFDEADELYKVLTKKVGADDVGPWVRWATFKMEKQGKPEAGRAVLQLALRALPKREHIAAISKFGILEFKYGETERGRTIFESILSNYPKHIDLWSVYLDQEIQRGGGDVAVVRRLFERVIALNLSSKKMKFFFKRYLDFEKKHGTEAGVQHVKDAARAYIAKKMDEAE